MIFFCSKQFLSNLLYSKFKILKLDDMIAMEYAKFIFKFNNHVLADSFNHNFTKFDSVHKYNIKQNSALNFFNFVFFLNRERKLSGWNSESQIERGSSPDHGSSSIFHFIKVARAEIS